jgi:predicted small integral membrane protein
MSEVPAANPQEITDREHLKLLAIFHYIIGGATILFSCFGLIHLTLGLWIIFSPDSFHGAKGEASPPPAFLGYLFAGIGAMFVAVRWTVGGLTLFSARSIQLCKRRMFTLVVAALNCVNCAFFPFGAILGTFTLVILSRASVQRLYESKAA